MNYFDFQPSKLEILQVQTSFLVTLTQILSAWELSIRQALAKMNINYAKQRQMMLLAPTAL